MKNKDKPKWQLLNSVSVPLKPKPNLKPNKSVLKSFENTPAKTNDFLNNIIESSLDGFIAVDGQGCIVRANKAFLKLLGYKEEGTGIIR